MMCRQVETKLSQVVLLRHSVQKPVRCSERPIDKSCVYIRAETLAELIATSRQIAARAGEIRTADLGPVVARSAILDRIWIAAVSIRISAVGRKTLAAAVVDREVSTCLKFDVNRKPLLPARSRFPPRRP